MSENKIVRETKLFKYNIESPTIAAEDIILSGIHLNSKLFGGETISTNFDVVQELAKNGITVGNRRAEQVIGFIMPVDEVRRGDKIVSVTAKRVDNDTSGGAEALANPVYMYIDMYDENNILIQTFFSKDPVQQTSGDVAINGVFQTTWDFENVVIKSRCSKLEFRFSTERGSRQTNVRIRSHAMRVSANSAKIQLPGFKTIYPGGSVQPYTTEFTAVFDVVVTGLQSHSEDTTLHLSPEKDQKIASIDRLDETLNGHIINGEIHTSVVEKQQISLNTNNIALLSSSVAAIQTSLQATIKNNSTLRQGLVAHIEGRLAAKCIQLSKQHFLQDYTDKKISEIHIPYYNSGNGDENKIAKLCVQFFSQEEEIIGKQVYSLNEVKQSTIGGTPESNFYFDNLIIPDDFRYVRLCFVPNDSVIPNGATCENCVDYRIRILSPSDNQKQFDDFDTDDCAVYTGSGNMGNYVGYVKIVTIHSVLDQLYELDEIPRCIEHVDDGDIHVTIDDKDRWDSKVDYETFDNRFGDLEKAFDTTPKEKIRNTKDIFFKDNTGNAARIHAWDMKTAEYVGEYLTQVTIYRPTNIAYIDSSDILHNKPQWLSVECLDVDGNLLDTYFSYDKDSQKDDDNTTTWNFNEIKIKEEYSKLRFRVTTQEGVLENQPQSMKRAILCYTYTNIPDTNDWGLIEQNNTVQAGHTMYFQFKTISKQQNFAAHVINEDVHVTVEDKERWNNLVVPEIPDLSQITAHVDDDDIHVTAEDKERWDSIVVPDPITYAAGNGIDISDNTISVVTTDVIEESDKIPTAKALYDTFYGERTFNNYDSSKYTEAADTAGTVVLSKKHFISGGRITKVTVPHGTTTGQYGDLDNGDPGYLVIDVFEEDTSFAEGYDKNTPTYRYWADDYYAYRNRFGEGHYEWTFNKRDCIIPENYKAVHLSLVIEEADVPNVGVGSSANARFRINCLAKNGDGEEGVVYEEDDECKLYWTGGTNGANRVAIVEVEYIGNKLNDYYIVPMLLQRISALEARVNELEKS